MNEAEKTAGCPSHRGAARVACPGRQTLAHTRMRDLQNLWMEVKTDKERKDRWMGDCRALLCGGKEWARSPAWTMSL